MDGSWFSAMGNWIVAAPVAAIAAVIACAAVLYTFLALFSLKRFAPPAGAAPAHALGVTVLKPLYGAEAELYGHLLSFCRQNYAGPVQIIFGVHHHDDPAAAAARRIVALARAGNIDGAPAGSAWSWWSTPRFTGPMARSPISSICRAASSIRLVVLADSDISVEPDYLDRLAAAIERPNVGLVTCLYRGRPLAGFWSRLGAMGVDYGFLPNVLTGMALNMAEPCVGATIALRRDTLEAIGGFDRIKDQLADDYMLGEAVREQGQEIAVADFVVGHAHSERSLSEVWRRDLRWARTIHSLDPLGHIGSAVTFPVAWALLAVLVSGFSPAMVGLAGAAVLARMILQFEIDQRFPGHDHAIWLGPVRDLFSFAVFVASFLPGQIHWRGHDYALGDGGVMTEVDEAEVGTA